MRALSFLRLSGLLATSVSALAALFLACGTSQESVYDAGPPREAGLGPDADPEFQNPVDSGVDADLRACAVDTQETKQLPLDMIILLDASGSLYQRTKDGTPKYQQMWSALVGFFKDPASAGLGVALQSFPKFANGAPNSCSSNADCPTGTPPCLLKACDKLTDAGKPRGCGEDSDCADLTDAHCTVVLGQCHENGEIKCRDANDCTGPDADGGTHDWGTCDPMVKTYCLHQATNCEADAYGTNFLVPLGSLPDTAPALESALNNLYPNGSTPTRPALEGAVDVAIARAKGAADHRVVVVLATDGFPTGCTNNTPNDSAKIAEDGLKQGIKTFVIGVFSAADLDVAQATFSAVTDAGGAGKPFMIDTNQNVADEFRKALDSIRHQALTCDFPLPKPEAGTPDYGKVNVRYTAGGSAVEEIFPNVAGPAQCSSTQGGWYYDFDPTTGTPNKVVLCPSACTRVQNDARAKMEIVQGCKTIALLK